MIRLKYLNCTSIALFFYLIATSSYSQDSLTIYTKKANALFEEKLYKEAIVSYTKALESANDTISKKVLLEKRGLAYFLDTNYDAAIYDFSYIIDSYDKKSLSNIYFLRAACRAKTDDKNGAFEDLNTAEELGHDIIRTQ